MRTDCGSLYGFCSLNGGYYLRIEGSLHKITRGQNAYNGYYDLFYVCQTLIDIVSYSYNIILPSFDKWFIDRVDIALCFDLKNQDNVRSYINSLSNCSFPRRNCKFYYDESVYFSGTSTTLKIYNKLLEFKKHDLKKFKDISIDDFLKKICGYVRFECEIKKKTLLKLINQTTGKVRIIDLNYDILKNVWSDEFMKLLKFINSDLDIVRGREQVFYTLCNNFSNSKANRLYNFYCSLLIEGQMNIKNKASKYTYFRNIKELQKLNIDISQCYKISDDEIFSFSPFSYEEVV